MSVDSVVRVGEIRPRIQSGHSNQGIGVIIGLVKPFMLRMACSWAILYILCCMVPIVSPNAMPQKGMDYLMKYSYVGPKNDDSTMQSLTSPDVIKMALKDFQRIAHLPITGEYDLATADAMTWKRCGNSEPMGRKNARRKKRYSIRNTKWGDNKIRYRIDSYTPDISKADVESAVRKAFQLWSDVSALSFEQVYHSAKADIIIDFVHGDHGDGSPFDSVGGTLAHAFFPHPGSELGGDAHFDEAERWNVQSHQGTDLFQVAAHEFGHSLGIEHSDVQSALMYPFYRGYVPNFQLDSDDIMAVQALYGVGVEMTDRPPRPTSGPLPTIPGGKDYCYDGQFDAMVDTADGSIYGFRGENYYRLDERGVSQMGRIRDGWPGLPNKLDAAIYWNNLEHEMWDFNRQKWQWERKKFTAFGDTWFFSNDRVYVFKNRQFQGVYGIRELFPRLPYNIDSAFRWTGNNEYYFTKGSEFYRVVPRDVNNPYGPMPVLGKYPRNIDVWLQFSGAHRYQIRHFDAAYNWKGRWTYFFVGPNFYRFDDEYFRIDDGYPKSVAQGWYGCKAGELQGSTTMTPDTDMEMKTKAEQNVVLVDTVSMSHSASPYAAVWSILYLLCLALSTAIYR